MPLFPLASIPEMVIRRHISPGEDWAWPLRPRTFPPAIGVAPPTAGSVRKLDELALLHIDLIGSLRLVRVDAADCDPARRSVTNGSDERSRIYRSPETSVGG